MGTDFSKCIGGLSVSKCIDSELQRRLTVERAERAALQSSYDALVRDYTRLQQSHVALAQQLKRGSSQKNVTPEAVFI